MLWHPDPLGGKARAQLNKYLVTTTNKENKQTLLLALTAALKDVNLLHGRDPSENISNLISLVDKLTTHKGLPKCVEILKAYRLQIHQYCLRQPVTPIPFCKTDKDGIARSIRFAKPDRDHVDCMRYSLSMLRVLEIIRLPAAYEVDTITSHSTANTMLVEELREFILSWPGLKLLPDLKPGQLILSNKAGPNGPATRSCLEDLFALRAVSNSSLLAAIQEMLKLSIPWFDLSKYKTSEKVSKLSSKLVLLSDKFGKTRVIAIADWFSNVALTPLHNAFMVGLRRKRGDVTYKQDQIPNLVKGLGTKLFSSDMTAFTDRFPIELEIAVIEGRYGANIAQLWKQILTDRVFYHPKGPVQYMAGNPMGLISSWPVSTFTHHAVKAYCAYKCRIKGYKYLILGDDTLDTNETVYKKYLKVIKELGVSISVSKCTSSKLGYTEFAKRLFTPKGEITGLPVHILSGIKSQPEQVLELVRLCIQRGYSKEELVPGVRALVERSKESVMLADILSLPKHILGMEPLWEPKPGTWAEQLQASNEGMQSELLKLSRESLFWDVVTNIDSVGKRTPTSAKSTGGLDPTHPLIFTLSEKIERYLPEEAYTSDFEEDEYWIYDRWMEGKYIHLVNIPSVDTYRFKNRGHKVTKCKFDVFVRLLRLVGGDSNITLHPRVKYSNQDLYDIALGRINPLTGN